MTQLSLVIDRCGDDSMSQECRWGILSTATIARKNWQAIRRSGAGVVAAVASRDVSRAERFIDECQAEQPFASRPVALGSYEELLANPAIDAVYIPLPTGVRKEWVIKAAQAGKHVMCEKPCAITADDLQEMIAACEAHGVQFMDGVMYMHSARMPRMREVLDEGSTVGEIRRITTQFSFRAPDEFLRENIRMSSELEPHGCLGDLGWYTIRFALWAMRYELPRAVTGRMLSQQGRADSPEAVPMEFSGELLFDGGVSAGFYCSFLTEHQQWVNISGSKGQIALNDFVLPWYGNELEFHGENARFVVDGCEFRMERHQRIHRLEEYSNSHATSQETNLFRTFGELVMSGTVDGHWPMVSLRTQQVMDACLTSARQGGVEVPLAR
ncbi:MAG: Gfo/Idh/MocA family oxidoreductase [Planctomycetaceae bacterium]